MKLFKLTKEANVYWETEVEAETEEEALKIGASLKSSDWEENQCGGWDIEVELVEDYDEEDDSSFWIPLKEGDDVREIV